jgi:hypothetical protein
MVTEDVLNLRINGKASTEAPFSLTFEEVPGPIIGGESHADIVL